MQPRSIKDSSSKEDIRTIKDYDKEIQTYLEQEKKNEQIQFLLDQENKNVTAVLLMYETKLQAYIKNLDDVINFQADYKKVINHIGAIAIRSKILAETHKALDQLKEEDLEKKAKNEKKIELLQKNIIEIQIETSKDLREILNEIKLFVARYEAAEKLASTSIPPLPEEFANVKREIRHCYTKRNILIAEKKLQPVDKISKKLALEKPILLNMIANFINETSHIAPDILYNQLKILVIVRGGEQLHHPKKNSQEIENKTGNLILDAINTYAACRATESKILKALPIEAEKGIEKIEKKEAQPNRHKEQERAEQSANRLNSFIEEVQKEQKDIEEKVQIYQKTQEDFLRTIQNKNIKTLLSKIMDDINREKILLDKRSALKNYKEKLIPEKESKTGSRDNKYEKTLSDLTELLETLPKDFKEHPHNLSRSITLIEKTAQFPDILASLKQLNKITLAEPIRIQFNDKRLSNLLTFSAKLDGANPGYQVKTDEHITYTVKQGSRVGNTLAEAYASMVLKKMEGIEEKKEDTLIPQSSEDKSQVISGDESKDISDKKFEVVEDDKSEVSSVEEKLEKKSDLSTPLIQKTVIAPAFLVIKKNQEPTDAKIAGVIKDKSPAEIETQIKQQIFVASEWSRDAYSLEACKLYGLEKRIRGAGSRLKSMFDMLRKLNKDCDLGLEAVALSAVFDADFDLHTENFMLKFNTSAVSEENKKLTQDNLEAFKLLIAARIKIYKKESADIELKKFNELTSATVTAENLVNDDSYYTILKNCILTLKEQNVEVYFHKIDHDSGFYRYDDAKRKVDFMTHMTAPVHITPDHKIKTQPTLHITELTGATKEGMDELLLTDKAIEIVMKNDIIKQMETLSHVNQEFFAEIHAKAQQLENLNANDKNNAELSLLNAFYYHITERNLVYPIQKKTIDAKITHAQKQIERALSRGAVYKMNDLHEQLYKRVIEIETKRPHEFERLKKLKNSLQEKIKINRAELLYLSWNEIKSTYDSRFFGQSSPDSQQIIAKLENIYAEKKMVNFKGAALKFFTNYACKPDSGNLKKKFCKTVLNLFALSTTIPINDPLFIDKSQELHNQSKAILKH